MKTNKLRTAFIKILLGAALVTFLATEFGSRSILGFIAWLLPHSWLWTGFDIASNSHQIALLFQIYLWFLVFAEGLKGYYLGRNIDVCDGLLNIEGQSRYARLDSLLEITAAAVPADFNKYKEKIRDAFVDLLSSSLNPGQGSKMTRMDLDLTFTAIDRVLYPETGKDMTKARRETVEEALRLYKEKAGNDSLATLFFDFLKGETRHRFKSFLVLVSPDFKDRVQVLIAGLPEEKKKGVQEEFDHFFFGEN